MEGTAYLDQLVDGMTTNFEAMVQKNVRLARAGIPQWRAIVGKGEADMDKEKVMQEILRNPIMQGTKFQDCLDVIRGLLEQVRSKL